MTEQQPAIRHWIGGNWAWTSTSLNPATGEVIGTYADAGAETGQAAIDARASDIVATLCRENGKLAPEAGYEAYFIPRAAVRRRGCGNDAGKRRRRF